MMSPEPHRLFLHFRELPLSLRVAYTGTLLVLSVGLHLLDGLHLCLARGPRR